MKKLEKFILSMVTFIGTTMLLTFLIVTVAQIVFRDTLGISIPWTEEMARFSFIWMMCFGTVTVQAHKEHVRMDFILNKIPFSIRSALQIIFDIASILFVVVIFKGAINMLEYASKTPISVSIPWLNASIMYIPLIITMPLIIFYLILDVFSQFSQASIKNIETRERMEE